MTRICQLVNYVSEPARLGVYKSTLESILVVAVPAIRAAAGCVCAWYCDGVGQHGRSREARRHESAALKSASERLHYQG